MLILTLLACGGGDDGTTTRKARAPEGHDTRDSAADTAEDPEDTGAAAPPEACAATSARGLCVLSDAAHWEDGEWSGTAPAGDGITLASTGLTSGTDTTGVYNGGDYAYGVYTSPVLEPGVAFDAAVPSWNADTPAGTWITVRMQARVGGAWTAWYRLGVWASDSTDVARRSFEGEADGDGEVWTDTLALGAPADAVRLQVALFTADGSASPTLSRLAVAVADTDARDADAGGAAWGVALDVPARSQMVFDEGEAWCSPTSTSMLLAHAYARTGDARMDVTVPEAADGTWDATYEGNGNWPFNVAYAASRGMEGQVGWLGAVSQLEDWVAAGVPVAVSAAWGPGDLDDAPISSTAGHLLVVTGFTAEGDVRVNDPAADSDAEVPRVYDRTQFAEVWLGGSGGVAYLLEAAP